MPSRTRLDPQEEARFQQWYAGWAQKAGISPNPDEPEHRYDYRGAYRAGAVPAIDPGDNRYHWPSAFKDDDHPNRFVGGMDTKTGLAMTSPYPDPRLVEEPVASFGDKLAAQSASPSPLDARMKAAVERSQNPLYRFGSALAGEDPDAGVSRLQEQQMREKLMGLQERQFGLQERQFDAQTKQFLVNKQMAVGRLAVDFLGKVADADPQSRAVLGKFGAEFLPPLFETLGLPMPKNAIAELASTPGLAKKYGALVGDLFGQDDATVKQIVTEIEGIRDPKEVRKYIEGRFEGAIKAARPNVQRRLAQWAEKVKGDPALLSQLGLIDKDGKKLPIPVSLVLKSVDQLFTTNAERAAAVDLVSNKDFAGWLTNIGIRSGETAGKVADQAALLPGKVQEAKETTLAKESTPGGQADIAAKRAAAEKPATDRAQLDRDLLAEARRRVLEPYKTGSLGAIELTDISKEELDAKIDAMYQKLRAEMGAPGKITTAPKPTEKKGRAATKADIEAANREAKGDKAKYLDILKRKGVDPSLPVR